MAEIYKIGSDDIVDRVSQFGGTNLFKLSDMSDRSKFVSNSSTDWTAYFRYYNGAISNHTFTQVRGSEYQDTILLNSASNSGICFAGTPADLGIDLNSYYTISCWAKSTQTAKQMCIGLSYMNTSDIWIWRGGTNGVSFSAANTWQKFTLTFKPDADTKAICYCFTVAGVANGTDTWTIKNCKLEKSNYKNKATDWTPAPQDLVKVVSGTQLRFF